MRRAVFDCCKWNTQVEGRPLFCPFPLILDGPAWDQVARLASELARETDPKKRMALWEQQTRQFYEKVPVIRYGDLFGLRAARSTVKDFNEKTERVRFYNVWLEK